MRMFEEPEVCRIFVAQAEVLLPEEHRRKLPHQIPPQMDPIYDEINIRQDNLGQAGEEYVMRLFMRLSWDQANKSLYDVLHCEESGIQRSSVVSYVHFTEIARCGTHVELGVSEVDFILDPGIKYVFNIRS